MYASKVHQWQKLRRVTVIPEVYTAVQRQLDRLESWAERNLKQLIKANAMSFTLGGIKPGTTTSWGAASWKAALLCFTVSSKERTWVF